MHLLSCWRPGRGSGLGSGRPGGGECGGRLRDRRPRSFKLALSHLRVVCVIGGRRTRPQATPGARHPRVEGER